MKNVKKDLIIGVDHGYGYMKTVHSIMKSGVKELPVEPPFSHNIIELDGKYYVVGQYIQKHQTIKTATQDYYILTLAAISEELKRQSLQRAEIIIAAGLPYSYFSSQKKEFKQYLLQNGTVRYKYDRVFYEVTIKDAYVFPQGFPIIAQELDEMKGRVCVVDVGSGTLDVLTFQDSQAQHDGCFSINGGINSCVEQIQKEFLNKYQTEPGENIIQDYLQSGRKGPSIDNEYYDFMDRMIKFYVANNIFGALAAKGVNINFTSLTICGGGTSIVKRYGEGIYRPSTRFIENIHANAQGYEYLCKGIII